MWGPTPCPSLSGAGDFLATIVLREGGPSVALLLP